MTASAKAVYCVRLPLDSVKLTRRTQLALTKEHGMAYLEITLQIDDSDRAAAAAVYTQYKQPFLDTVPGAASKELLIRGEDVQVLHGFDSTSSAEAYLTSDLFTSDVVGGLSPLLKAQPEIRIYDVA